MITNLPEIKHGYLGPRPHKRRGARRRRTLGVYLMIAANSTGSGELLATGLVVAEEQHTPYLLGDRFLRFDQRATRKTVAARSHGLNARPGKKWQPLSPVGTGKAERGTWRGLYPMKRAICGTWNAESWNVWVPHLSANGVICLLTSSAGSSNTRPRAKPTTPPC
jgi:hypothetical protein